MGPRSGDAGRRQVVPSALRLRDHDRRAIRSRSRRLGRRVRSTGDGVARHPDVRELKAAIAQDWDPAPPCRIRPGRTARRSPRGAALPSRPRSPASSSSCRPGAPKIRANDTEYPFRAASSFTWLTGETVADAVLVMTPNPDRARGHPLRRRVRASRATSRTSPAALHGAVWVGNVPVRRGHGRGARIWPRGRWASWH